MSSIPAIAGADTKLMSSFSCVPTAKVSPEKDVVVCGVIGPTNINEIHQPCPCCNRRVSPSVEVRQTLDEPRGQARQDIPCLFDSEEHDEEEDYDEDYLPGVLDSGVEYKFKRVLAEGWVHKKGTGNDWMGSRSFKARWARLVLAKVDGFGEVDVPLLQIYWFRASERPSTVILLDSTVVLPVDKEESETCYPHRFHIVHAKDDESGTRVARSFAVARKGRDQWVYAINSALLKYEKDCAQARREAAALQDLRPKHSAFDVILDGERFRTISEYSNSRPISPPPMGRPLSPLFPKRPLPRPDQLLGESLLVSEPLVGEALLD
jgi:hypothetical protein